MTGSTLLTALQSDKLLHALLYRHPDIHVIISSPEFAHSELATDENREAWVVQKLGEGWTVALLRTVANQAGFVLSFLLPAEYERLYRAPKSRSTGWAGELLYSLGLQPAERLVHPEPQGVQLPTFHFYGYKGGQARSTVLGMLSKALAAAGWRVLVVDADLEAPSLDLLFDCRPVRRACTLLGVSLGDQPEPLAAFRPTGNLHGGKIDLLACRPAEATFDLEALAFAMRCSADPIALERTLARIAAWAGAAPSQDARYDVLFIDHRAGLSPFVLPCLSRLPGPIVIFTRLDEQWTAAERHLPSLLRANPKLPGLFVAFQPDNEEIREYRFRNRPQINRLLEHLADAFNTSPRLTGSLNKADEQTIADSPDGSEDDSWVVEDLQDYLLVWPYDSSFRASRLPTIEQLTGTCKQTLKDLRSLLDLSANRSSPITTTAASSATLHPSGGADQGTLIETEALRRLHSKDSPIRFIFGRKGTGKTRLFRELSNRKLGDALLADPEQPQEVGGLRATDATIRKAINLFSEHNQPENFWWLLFICGLEQMTSNTNPLRQQLDIELTTPRNTNVYIDRLLAAAMKQNQRRVFLLDALEVALPANKSAKFVEALFGVLATLRSDDRLSSTIDFRLFLRVDLAKGAIQNIEQLTAGQKIDLQWDTQSIWNFALSRLIELPFFQSHFPNVIDEIRRNQELIRHGRFSESDCEQCFKNIFPAYISDKIKITTFLKTYFSDNVQEKETGGERTTYYPRVFDKFLQVIANHADELVQGKRFNEFAIRPDKYWAGSQRINPNLVIFAHQAAAVAYLEQVRQELAFMLQLDASDPDRNGTQIQKLLDALAGQSSPFKPDDLAVHLVNSTQFIRGEVMTALEQMLSIGIFEKHPDYPTAWRVGRLFKTALRMKYQRGGKNSTWRA